MASHMGDTFSNVVRACLVDDNWEIGQGDVDMEMSVHFVEAVIDPLHAIIF